MGEDLLALNMKGGIPVIEGAKLIRQQATLIDYYKVRDDSNKKIIADLVKEVKEFHKIAQTMAMKESDARKELQNYKDGIK